MTIVYELPDGVELSEHLREHATFYICVMYSGLNYYIAATPNVRRLFELNDKGEPDKPDKRRRWTEYEKAYALRDIIAALHLQTRDVVLAGIESNVSRTLLGRMDELMRPTVQREIANETRLLNNGSKHDNETG